MPRRFVSVMAGCTMCMALGEREMGVRDIGNRECAQEKTSYQEQGKFLHNPAFVIIAVQSLASGNFFFRKVFYSRLDGNRLIFRGRHFLR
jgi:hypothetical protein